MRHNFLKRKKKTHNKKYLWVSYKWHKYIQGNLKKTLKTVKSKTKILELKNIVLRFKNSVD